MDRNGRRSGVREFESGRVFLFSISIHGDDDDNDGGFPFLLNERRGQLDSWKSDDRNLCPICRKEGNVDLLQLHDSPQQRSRPQVDEGLSIDGDLHVIACLEVSLLRHSRVAAALWK